MRPTPALAALALAAAPLFAQQQAAAPTQAPGAPDPARVQAGTYRVEPEHTQILFGVDHLGFNPYYGNFSRVSGTLQIDPANPSRARVDITVPVSSVKTTNATLDAELVSPMFFDAAKFPEMRFVSTAVDVRQGQARVTGDLTMHGVTRPVTLEVLFHGAGAAMQSNVPTLGFEGRARIKRSDFGINYGLPLVSDEVTVIITAAFEKQG